MSATASPSARAPQYAGPTVPVIFHVDLTGIDNADACSVHAGGTDLPLVAHTPETLAAAIAGFPALAARGRRPTHYTRQAASLPADRALNVIVYRPTPQLPWGESFVFLAIFRPPVGDALKDALSRTTALTQKICWISTAESLLASHPNVLTWNLGASQAVHDVLNSSAAFIDEVNHLAQLLEGYGLPGVGTGWANLAPFTPDNPIFNNQTVAWTQVIPAVTGSQQMQQVTGAMLIAVKNAPALENQLWHVTPGTAVQQQTGAVAGAADDDWTVAITDSAQGYGVQMSATTANSALRQVALSINNYFIRSLSVYVNFLDADGNVVQVPLTNAWETVLVSGGSSVEMNLIEEIALFQVENTPYLGHVSPVFTLMGLPITAAPGTFQCVLQFPVGATSMQVYCCGLGTGSNPVPAMPAIGGLLTGIMSLGLPALMMALAAQNSDQEATESAVNTVMQSGAFKAAVTVIAAAIVGEAVKSCVVGQPDWALMSSFAQTLFSEAFVPVMGLLTTEVTADTILKAVPVVGTVFATLSVVADAYQIAYTIIDICSSEWRIQNAVTVTINTAVTLYPDPRHQVFPAGGTTCVVSMIFQDSRPTAQQTISIQDPGVTLSTVFVNTLGGTVKFEADFYVGTFMAGKATSGWMPNNDVNTAAITLTLVEIPVPLSSTSVYQIFQLLTYQPAIGAYEWKTVTGESSITRASANNSAQGNAISEWVGITLSQRVGSLGYAWKASGMGIGDTTTGVDGQLYAMQNVNIPGLGMAMLKFPPSGFTGPTALIYDTYPPKFLMVNGNWVINPATNKPEPDPSDTPLGYFYIDPRKAGNDPGVDGGYHLRQVVLDDTTPFDMDAGQPSFGRFATFPTSVAMHPTGAIVAVDADSNVLYVLKGGVPAAQDADALMARSHAGPAQQAERQGLLSNPIAVACSYDGTIYVLESNPGAVVPGVPTRIQAFDLKGNPIMRFQGSGGLSSPFLLLSNSAGITYLDLAVIGSEQQTYLYVLGYSGAGDAVTDYTMSIYQVGGSGGATAGLLVATPSLNAAAIVVDMWHSVYALDWAMTSNGAGQIVGPNIQNGNNYLGPLGRTVPSVSLWLPPVPSGA